jgi:putative membrane protein
MEIPMLKRRVVLAGLTAAAIAGPALTRKASARDAGAAPSKGEEEWISKTMPIGALSLAVSRVALDKARFPKLKEFAQFEVAEQETVADVLKALQNPGDVTGTVKAPTDAELHSSLDQAAKQTLEKMQSAKEGATFDHDYLDAQVEGHEQLLRIQDDYLKSGRDLDGINVAKLARGQIKEHLRLLADIKNEMGAKHS